MPHFYRICALCILAFTLNACKSTTKTDMPSASLQTLSWQAVENWQLGAQHQAWQALQHNCQIMQKKIYWREICHAKHKNSNPDAAQARDFLQTWFTPYRLYAQNGRKHGLLTGYYVPLLRGSWHRDSRYRYPIYGVPDTLQRDGKSLRVVANTKTPFYTRAQIESTPSLLAGHEILWVDNAADAFFLHVQGSGKIQMPNGEIVMLGFADHNGQPYTSIGKVLIEQGAIKKQDVSLFSIKKWLAKHPAHAAQVMQQNARYIFFRKLPKSKQSGAVVGAMNIPLTPQRSIAIDPKIVPLGSAVWLQSNLPGQAKNSYQRLVFAQDTGAAIKNALRADLFWGHGEMAEQQAGVMKESLQLILLLPKQQPPPLPLLNP